MEFKEVTMFVFRRAYQQSYDLHPDRSIIPYHILDEEELLQCVLDNAVCYCASHWSSTAVLIPPLRSAVVPSCW